MKTQAISSFQLNKPYSDSFQKLMDKAIRNLSKTRKTQTNQRRDKSFEKESEQTFIKPLFPAIAHIRTALHTKSKLSSKHINRQFLDSSFFEREKMVLNLRKTRLDCIGEDSRSKIASGVARNSFPMKDELRKMRSIGRVDGMKKKADEIQYSPWVVELQEDHPEDLRT